MYDSIFKLAIIGDDRVGKTALIRRYISGIFTREQKLTISADFFTKVVNIQGKKVKLEFWMYRGIHLFSSYLRRVNGIVYIYDITNKDSLTNLYYLLDVIKKFEEKIPIFLIGNKSDLHEKRKITREKGIEIADEIGAHVFVETSAKEGLNVQSVFEVIVDLFIEEEPLKQRPIKMTNQLKEKIKIAKKSIAEWRGEKKLIKAQKEFESEIEKTFDFKKQKVKLQKIEETRKIKIEPKESLLEKYKRDLREGKSVPSDYWKAAEIPISELKILEGLESQFSIDLVEDVNDINRGYFLNGCSFSIMDNIINGLSFNDCDFTTLPESIFNLSSLKSLRIVNTDLEILPKSIGDFSLLERLFISGCLLILLPDAIGKLSSLKSLFINAPIIRLPSSIGNLNSLTELELFGTKMSSLPDSIGNLLSLKKLRLSGPIKHLPEFIANLQNLNTLELYQHRLQHVPDSMLKLPSLKKLYISLSIYEKPVQFSESLRKNLESRGVELSIEMD